VAVVEIDQVRVSCQALGEEIVEGAGAFVEIEAEEGGVGQQIAAERDGAERDVGGTGDVLPGVAGGVELLRQRDEMPGIVRGRERAS